MEVLGCGPSCVILWDRKRATVTWTVKWKADLSAATSNDIAISDIPSTHFNQESRPGQSDVRPSVVLRADQPQATLPPGASPKKEGCAECS